MSESSLKEDAKGQAGIAPQSAPAVLVARSSLVLPCRFDGDGLDGDCGKRAERFLRRAFPSKNQPERTAFLWEVDPDRPAEVRELDPAFQAILGGTGGTVSPWAAQRLRLASPMTDLLRGARVVRVRRGEEVAFFDLHSVELFLFPLDTGVLAFNVSWRGRQGLDPPSLDEIASSLFRVRRVREERSAVVWHFDTYPSDAQRALLGPLAGAFEPETGVGLAEVARWLLLYPEEQDPLRADRLSSSDFLFHHTALVLDRPPDGEELHQRLFQLQRGLDGGYPAPPPGDRLYGEVLAFRGNHRMAVGREGIVSLSWIASPEKREYETKNWPAKFQGVFRLLAFHAHAERATLGALAASAGRHVAGLSDLPRVADLRDDLFDLARGMVRYTVSLAGEHCGGTTELDEFFRAVRRALGTPEQLAEVRAEVEELFNLVEAAHERRQLEQDQRFQRNIGALGAIGVAFAIITGTLGSNKPDGVELGPFLLAVVLGCLLLAIVVLLLIRSGQVHSSKGKR